MERAVFQHFSTLQVVVHPSDLLIHLSTTALGPPKPPTTTTTTQVPSPTSELPLLSWAESVGLELSELHFLLFILKPQCVITFQSLRLLQSFLSLISLLQGGSQALMSF